MESAEKVISTTQLGANSAQRMESQSILEEQVITYIRERTNEHLNNFEGRITDSFMLKHQTNNPPGQPLVFQAKVVGKFHDCLSCQVAEGVEIRRCEYQLINAKTE